MKKLRVCFEVFVLCLLGCPADPASIDETQEDQKPPTGPPHPEGMVLVKGGHFYMGTNDFTDAQPTRLETISTFYLDKTEVTMESYQNCIREKKCTPPTMDVNSNPLCNYDSTKNLPVDGKENHPVNCVTFIQAQEYCHAQGKRLPTEIEWEYAARGNLGSLYPWGNTPPSDTIACFGKTDGTCEVKKFSSTLLGEDQSDPMKPMQVGVYDLAGNVWEWTDSEYSPSLIYPQKTCSTSCVVKGGSYYNTDAKYLRSSFRLNATIDFVAPEYGFRCAFSN